MGARVRGVGPGTTLGDRYALRRRLSHGPELERWSALDVTLSREVTLTVVSAGHPNCAGVIDAARRAAGVEDARLVRILDVGAQNDTAFIVEESRSGSESLATTLLRGPLPAEEARRVAGETAKGLETAGQRGLHHLRLTPHNVLIAPDGAIKVSGVTVAAAIEGPGEQEPEAGTALHRDALCLVAIVYAALTSRWPLAERVPGLESAPRVGAVVVAPSEIVAGVPADLDTLCRTTFNEGSGPLTPGDFALQIAPWPHERIHRAGVDPTLVLRLPGSDNHSNLAAVTAAGVASVAVPVAGDETKRHVAAPKEELASQSPSTRAPEPVSTSAVKGAAATSVFRAPFDGSGAAGGPPGSSATTGAGASADHSVRTGDRMRLPVGLSSKDEIGPPLPLLPASTALPPSRGQSKVVMVVMAVFVVAALFVGFRGLLSPGSDATQGKPTPRRTVTVSGPAVTVPASPAPQAAATAGGPIAILSATGFDPQGDQGENNSQAARVYDGNPATTWTSELYNTAQFGNLKKGVGLLLDLGQPTSVHQVTIDLANGPVDITVYAATSPSLTGAAEIGTVKGATGRVQVKAATSMPESEFIIVWFSSLAQEGGKFGASVSEIALS